MKNFTHSGDIISSLLKCLRQCYNIWNFIAEVSIEIIDFYLIWTETSEKRRPCRIAKRQLIVSPLKTYTSCSESVDVWRFRNLIAIAPKRACKVIHGNKQDIRFRDLRRLCTNNTIISQKKKDEEYPCQFQQNALPCWNTFS